MQKLILVCGLPGGGKTTFAKALSKQLNIVCFHKDSLKEGLYDYRRANSLEDSKALGRESVHMLYQLAEEQLANGVDLIIESPLYFEEDYALLRKWEKRYNLTIHTILCTIESETRHKRFRERDRHASHHDTDRELNLNMNNDVYHKIPGKLVTIQTDKPVKELVDSVLEKLK